MILLINHVVNIAEREEDFSMDNLILLGAPGSGKGTQSAKLVELQSYSHISTGNLLRDEIAKESDLGVKVKEVMKSGQLVSDELVIELLSSNLDLAQSAYIFDGYPRNIDQAKTLTSLLGSYPFKAIFFKLDTEILVERLGSRRVTKDGKYIYNLTTNPPKTAGVCDVTGEALLQRDDDRAEVVRKRMEVYEKTINPVLEYYRQLDKLIEIDANNSLEEVYSELMEKLS